MIEMMEAALTVRVSIKVEEEATAEKTLSPSSRAGESRENGAVWTLTHTRKTAANRQYRCKSRSLSLSLVSKALGFPSLERPLN